MFVIAPPTKQAGVFLALTFALSAVCYAFLLAPQPVEAFGPGLIASPAIAAIVTRLLFARPAGRLGLSPGPLRYLAAGYAIPFGYGLAVYALIWLSGIGGFSPQALADQAAGQAAIGSPGTFVLTYGLNTATLGMLLSCLTAFGEELGWRGLLVPALAQRYSLQATSLISGAAWAIWHYPAILFVDYHNAGAPLWFGLICFTAMVLGISVVMAWLRLASGSVWPAVLFHASHNAFIQTLFNPLTAKTRLTPYVIDEFGVGLALAALALAWVVWRGQGSASRAPA